MTGGHRAIDSLDANTATEGAGLDRVLGPIDITCIVVGAIIGVGIFFTPSRVANLAGSGGLALTAWAVGGAIALMGALTFAELGGMYPRSGGQYVVLRDAYGPLPAFLFVFCNATAIQAGAIAIIAIVCCQNLGLAVTGSMPGSFTLLAVAAILIIGLTTANVLGVKWGSGIQNVTVYAKVATLLAVTLLAAMADPAETAMDASGPAGGGGVADLGVLGALFAALVPALFTFGGWQHALWIAGEVRRPGRNLPLGIIGGVVLVVAVYLLVNWAYLRLLGYRGVAASEALAADAVAAVWPGSGRRAIAAAVAVSAFGVLNAQLLSGPRLIYGMAADGRFFKPFAWVSPRFRTPLPAIVLLGSMALGLLFAAGVRGLDKLLTGVVFIDGVFFALTASALFVLRRKHPTAGRRAGAYGYPVGPAMFVLGEVGVIIGAYCDRSVRGAAFIGLAWMLAAALCYILFFRRAKGN